MIVTTPAATPVTTPEDGFTVAKDGLLLAQLPPGGVQLSVVVLPTHTLKVPVIAPICAIEASEINKARMNKVIFFINLDLIQIYTK